MNVSSLRIEPQHVSSAAKASRILVFAGSAKSRSSSAKDVGQDLRSPESRSSGQILTAGSLTASSSLEKSLHECIPSPGQWRQQRTDTEILQSQRRAGHEGRRTSSTISAAQKTHGPRQVFTAGGSSPSSSVEKSPTGTRRDGQG